MRFFSEESGTRSCVSTQRRETGLVSPAAAALETVEVRDSARTHSGTYSAHYETKSHELKNRKLSQITVHEAHWPTCRGS